ncbi:MAG: hypothetical protein IJ607_07450 [Bacteroidaceae bacterium]|nr:hypothetical protein [Bacteroidaceae bacterium]
MKKTYIKPISQQFFSSFLTETMSPSGTHSIDPFKESTPVDIGGDEEDVAAPSSTKSRDEILWGTKEPTPPTGLW